MIKVVEFVVKGSQLPTNTINGNDMQNTRQIRHIHGNCTAATHEVVLLYVYDTGRCIVLWPFINNSNHADGHGKRNLAALQVVDGITHTDKANLK